MIIQLFVKQNYNLLFLSIYFTVFDIHFKCNGNYNIDSTIINAFSMFSSKLLLCYTSLTIPLIY